MKVIFLDIDGVLNTSKTFEDIYYELKETNNRRIEIDEKRLEYLKEIIDKTGAKIVLSSTWRIYLEKLGEDFIPTNYRAMELLELLKKHNIEIYDITPMDNLRNRQKEINMWMINKDIEGFVVIDDDFRYLTDFFPDHIIKTIFSLSDNYKNQIEEKCGLCEFHIEEAINKLNNTNTMKRRYNNNLFSNIK